MLCPIRHLLANKRIILASGSPRRQELIRNIGLQDVELCPSEFAEDLKIEDFANFSEFVEETALQKALEVHERLSKSSKNAPDIIIAADTMVTLNGKMYGKPNTPEIAFQMLSDLIGKSHIVYTGVVVKHVKGVEKFTEQAKVFFGKATEEQIRAYIETGEPMDKAGGYGIQGIGGTMIERIEGDYFTVMGLPLYKLSCTLCQIFGYEIK